MLILFAFILLATTVWLGVSKHQNQQELNRLRREYLELKSNDDAVKKIKSRRVEYFRIKWFLNSPSRIAFASAAFIRKLGSLHGGQLVFSELSLVPGNQNVVFRLKAIVQSREKDLQSRMADAFCQQLKNWEEIFDVSCLLGNSGDAKPKQPVLVVNGKIEVE